VFDQATADERGDVWTVLRYGKKLRKLALDVLARLYQAGNNQGDIEIINAGQHNSIKIQLFVYKPWTFNSKWISF